MNTATQHILGAATAAGLIFASLALSAPEAKAAPALWYEGDGWTVEGDYAGYCMATAGWTTGQYMGVSLSKVNGWTMFFRSDTAVPLVVGGPVAAQMITSTGIRYNLNGTAIGPTSVSFGLLTADFVKSLALSRSVTIKDVGTFGMKGSMKAILKTVDCFRAITGKAA